MHGNRQGDAGKSRATDHFSVQRTETPPIDQLLQRNFASKDTSDRSCVLDTLVNHLLLFAFVSILFHTKIKARLYFAIAADDDKREPEVKNKLREAFTAAKVRAEIEVYPNALHGWCVPDSKAAENKQDAERAWGKLVALYEQAL